MSEDVVRAASAAPVRHHRRLLVVGWDGADWRLLRPWIEAGHLPTLRRLVNAGAHGPLRSTIRPESSVAWSSFLTGVNPGKHGVFGFAGPDEVGSYAFPLHNAASLRAPCFWEYLGSDTKIGLVNVPFTYPVRALNGFMVAGMMTPSVESDFTYPPSLKKELLQRFEGYVTDVSGPGDDKPRLVQNVAAFTEQQRRTALALMGEQKWDCFVAVFTGPDRLQHFLWSDTDAAHPLHGSEPNELSNALLEHYHLLDAALADLIASAPPETLVLLLSDHGFSGCRRKVRINAWLAARGDLTLRSSGGAWRRALHVARRLHRNPLLRRLKSALLPETIRLSSLQAASFAHAIDWSRTTAYFGLDGGLRINLAGREQQGIVPPTDYQAECERLRTELLALRDPATGAPALAAVYHRDELYHGPHVALAPDLILEPQRDQTDPGRNTILDGALPSTSATRPIFADSHPYSGNHALDGIFCAWGPGVVAGELGAGASIVDLAPTLLACLGIAPPAGMDGVLLPIFEPATATAIEKLARPAASPALTGWGGTGFDAAAGDGAARDAELVEERLRDLGYL